MKKLTPLAALVFVLISVISASAQQRARVAIHFERKPMVVFDDRNLEVAGEVLGLRKGTSFALTWVDALGRVMDRYEGTMKGSGSVRFAFDVGESRTVYNMVLCHVGRTPNPSAVNHFLVPLVQTKWQGFWLLTMRGTEKDKEIVPALLRAAGVRGFVGDAGVPLHEILSGNMALFPILTPAPLELATPEGQHKENAKKYVTDWSVKCLERPESVYGSREKMNVGKALDELVDNFQIFNPAGFLLGRNLGLVPPNMIFDYDFSKRETGAWREALKAEYKSSRKLGKLWKETIIRWDNLYPASTVGVVRANRERKENAPLNVARWLSFREHMDRKFYELVESAIKRGSSFEPPVRVGLGGPIDIVGFAGMDPNRLLELAGFAFVGTSDIEQVLCKRAASRTRLLALIDSDSANGARSLWIAALNRYAGAVATDPGNIGRTVKNMGKGPSSAFLSANREIAEHYGPLLRSARMKRPIAAMYYSRKSQFASLILDAMAHPEKFPESLLKKGYDSLTYPAVIEHWSRILNDLGIAFDVIVEADFATKEFMQKPYRIIILPRALVLSDSELKSMNDFVAKGGILVADSGTAVFDGYGVQVKRKNFESLFGVRRDACSPAELNASLLKTGVKFGPRRGRSKFKHLLYAINTEKLAPGELALRTRGASARLLAEKVPGLMINRVKSGYAIMLNLSTLTYSYRGEKSDNTVIRDVLFNLFEDLKVVYPARIIENGKYARGYRLWSYELDRGDIYAILPAVGSINKLKKATVEFLLAEERYVYDIRSGELLGRGDRIVIKPDADTPTLLAALTYNARFVKTESFLDGPSVQFEAGIMLDGNRRPFRHIFSAMLIKDDAAIYPPVFVSSTGGNAVGEIYIGRALPTGKYTLRVRDLLTGIEGERDMIISARRIAE